MRLIEFEEEPEDMGELACGVPNILVVGCGGAGNNEVNRLNEIGIKGAKTIALNTDSQALHRTVADVKILIGKSITSGMGAGGDPKLGKRCMDVSRPSVESLVRNANLVFITAGMGGGTGTGSAPIVAEIAREQGAIVVAIVTTPFDIERDRLYKAEVGLDELDQFAHSVIVLDNNQLIPQVGNKPVNEAFKVMDNIIAEIIKGITEVITEPSLINLDYNDVKSVMQHGGASTMLYGKALAIDPEDVVETVLSHQLLDVDIRGATGALVHISCSEKLSLMNLQEIADGITQNLDEGANVILGARIDPNLDDEVKVMSIITGLGTYDEPEMDAAQKQNWDKWQIQAVW